MTDTTTVRPDEYNGWGNRETWLASLWISNEEGSYREAVELLTETATEYLGDNGLDAGAELPPFLLANVLEEWATAAFLDPATEQTGNAGFITDLLGTAWARIDWQEVAAGLAEDAAADL